MPEDRANRYLVVTIGVSVLLHIVVGLLLIVSGNIEQRRMSKRGEPLLVDIAPDRPRESAPLGDPSRPVGPDAPAPPRRAAPPAPPAPPAPRAAPIPPAPAPAPAARSAPPAPRAADAPKAVAKAAPAPEKSEEPGPAAKAAPPAPAPEQTQAAKATPQPAAPPQQLGAPSPPRVASTPPESSATSGMFRRGGGGGLKGGRGGIEGEAIPLDTPDPRYQDYFNQIRERIKSKWIYPYEASSRGIGGELSIEFGIAKSGELQFIERKRSSGVEILDDYAMRAVQLASPFPPVPDAISKGGLPIHGIFRYQLLGSGLINNYLR
ncbi:MAG TPA: energy transducer TonB [Candidatus Bathyarchaeia archaeon]|nr:energy transducer TonB [Candidatus Bathyarchaeia archaeon]